jgi:lipid-A-disaccharide synthase
MLSSERHKRTIFLVLGEESGDQLAASLVAEVQKDADNPFQFQGLAGPKLQALGIKSLFPLSDIAVMGLAPVLMRLPTLIRRVYKTVQAILAAKPDAVLIIDSPDFTHAVAKRVKARAPAIPIYGWVSPSVWAWRPGRARVMARYLDHLFCLLPFEPETHLHLGGPPCTYVGHPLASRLAEFQPQPGERPLPDEVDKPTILLLPGSRQGEIKRHLPLFCKVLEEYTALSVEANFIMPCVEHLYEGVKTEVKSWPFPVTVIRGEAERLAAMRQAHAALAASGTVTLELAVAGVPMVAVYKLDWLASLFQGLVKVWTILLPNLVVGRPFVREYLSCMARPNALARALVMLSTDTPERAAQLEGCAEVREKLKTPQSAGKTIYDFLKEIHNQ